jgi:hypothetical protein
MVYCYAIANLKQPSPSEILVEREKTLLKLVLRRYILSTASKSLHLLNHGCNNMRSASHKDNCNLEVFI